MADKLRLDIVTPYGEVFSGEVDEVTASGSEGDFGVLPGHAPFVTTLDIGMFLCKAGGKQEVFFVNSGYAEVGPGRVVVMADSAERSEDIDIERAKEAMARAEQRLKQAAKIDFARAEAALERAANRIQAAKMK